MKRTVVLMLVCAMLVSMSGCTNQAAKETTAGVETTIASSESQAVQETETNETTAETEAASESEAETEEVEISTDYKLGNVMLRMPSGYKKVDTKSIKLESVGIQKMGSEKSGTVLFMYDHTDRKVSSESDYVEAADQFFTDLFGDSSGIETGGVKDPIKMKAFV